MICTIYSHHTGFDRIIATLEEIFPYGQISESEQDGFHIAELKVKNGFFGSTKKLKISYRQRLNPSYRLTETSACPLMSNLTGLYNYVASLPANRPDIRELFLQKIQTINAEFSIIQEKGEFKSLTRLIESLAIGFDAFLFAQDKTPISKTKGQHFLDRNLQLLLDTKGNCTVDDLPVSINSHYYDTLQETLSEHQKSRKAENEELIKRHGIRVNPHLPCSPEASRITLRTPEEITRRISVLAVVNLFAFDSLNADEATAYLRQYHLWEFVTPGEKDLLANPDEEKKRLATWKCEAIWTLMWALNKVPELGFPDQLCQLNDIASADYPVGPDKDPNTFIQSVQNIRSNEDILNARDLYYRLHWACTNARLSNTDIKAVHPGVVYERFYALNWLIRYQGHEWDAVSCDT